MAYASIEPFGEYRSELRHGHMMAFTANLNRDPEKRREPYKAIDFMHFVDTPPERKLTDEEIEQHLAGIFGK